MAKWKIRDERLKTLEDVVSAKSGCDIKALLDDTLTRPAHHIDNIDKAIDMVKKAVDGGKPIGIIGDYDVDGICGAAILYLWITEGLHYKNVETIIPKRFTEGYGAIPAQVDRLKPGLLITVDNGISAYEAIEHAKELGFEVLVLDHHLPISDRPLPPADLIIDPEAFPGTADCEYYSGAGLAFCLVSEAEGLDPKYVRDIPRYFFPTSCGYMSKVAVMAGVATVADCVELKGDNRFIVSYAAKTILDGPSLPHSGIFQLMKETGIYDDRWIVPYTYHKIFTEDVAFKLGPAINALGRLQDAGAAVVYCLFVNDDEEASAILAKALVRSNEERKVLQASWYPRIKQAIEDNGWDKDVPLCAYVPGLPQGLVGIFAGRFADERHVPVIIFTDGQENGVLHGSARSVPGVDIKAVLDESADVFVKHGGHAGAAGVTVEASRFDEMRNRLQQSLASFVFDNSKYYDLELDAGAVRTTVNMLERLLPFGKGCDMPVFAIKTRVNPGASGFAKKLGANKEHIKFCIDGVDVMAFFKTAQYEALGEPRSITFYGKFSWSSYMGVVMPQFVVEDMEIWQEGIVRVETGLAKLLKLKAGI